MLTVKKYGSIHQIGKQHWDSIADDEDIFHSHQFVSIVEDSKIENSEFFYLLFYDKEKLVATTMLFAFTFSLDIFITSKIAARILRKMFRNLFRLKILVCGLPASFGQPNLKLADEKYAPEVCSLLSQHMRSIAKEKKIKFIAIKEFNEKWIAALRQFEHDGFFVANSIPYMKLTIRWKNFSEYMETLRHHYRRKIRLSLKKIQQSSPRVISIEEYDVTGDEPAFILSSPNESFAEEFYRMYLRVMERTTTKLETLNLDFFKFLFQYKEDYKILSLVVKSKVISSAVLVSKPDKLTFMLVARANEKDEYDSYFNLFYAIISLAIENRCKEINLGQAAYWVKQCVGGEPENEYIWFASTGKFRHWALKKLRHVIFPSLKLKSLHVFKCHKDIILINKKQSPESIYNFGHE